MLALGVIFDELLSYTRSLSAINRLRALFMVEECVGVPPHPGNPPTKRPLVHLMKQGWFLTRNVHQSPSVTLVQPRLALSYMRGPMTLSDIKRALGRKLGVGFGHGLTPDSARSPTSNGDLDGLRGKARLDVAFVTAQLNQLEASRTNQCGRQS